MYVPPGAASRTTRRGTLALLALVLLSAAWPAVAADGARILRLRHFSGPEHTRIVLDLDRPCSFEVRRVEDPDRIAINLQGAVFAGGGDQRLGDGVVDGIRCGVGDGRAQVVLDLAGRREFKAFSLPPAAGKPDRIVIDVLRESASPPVVADAPADSAAGVPDAEMGPTVADDIVGATADEPGEQTDDAPEAVAAPAATAVPTEVADDPFIVIIDPGHGGDDPGAMRGSLQEKDICLDIGREVARLLGREPGVRVVMTRDRDQTLALGRRVDIARREKGDVFLSIHCNTHPRPAVSGMEVYFLSLQGASDREARELADKENAAGLVGLTPGGDHADLVMDILMDLKMTRVLHDSGRLATSLLAAADRSGVVPGRSVKQAGFQVLKTLAMPSALVEVAYLSNPGDQRLLDDPAGRRRVAAVIVAGLLDWRSGIAPSRTRPLPVIAARDSGEGWETVYKVRRGDSLWRLADRYGTTMNEIARRNHLSERQRELRIGQRLRLPGTGVRP